MNKTKTNFAKMREAVQERCFNHCEKCGQQLKETWALHHRKLKSRGGKDTYSNFVALHHECHNMGTNSVHLNPEKAEQLGLMVSSWQEPSDVPLILPSGDIVLLRDDGSYHYLERKANGW